jgi:long-chain acyl-CoA synthetase
MQINMLYGLYPIGPGDSMLSVLPLSHTYECSLGMIYVLATGATSTYLEKPPTASILLPALRKVRPTCFFIVPLIIEKVFRSQIYAKFTSTPMLRAIYNNSFGRRLLHRLAGNKLHKAFGGRVRLFIGGAKLDEQVEQFLIDAKFPYAIGYGLTETAPLVAGQISPAVKLGATGPQMNGVTVRLDNVNPDTKQGEIVVSSPSVMQGYYKNPEATAEAFTEDGWFRTGDLGYIDEDGFIFIKGRLKNMILGPSGENIYPEEIESVLNTNTYVSESIVTEQDGQLVALIHFDSDAIEKLKNEFMEKWEITRDELSQKVDEWNARKEELKSDILKYVNSKVNRFSRISKVIEEEAEFIKTPTSKIRRFRYNKKSDASKQNTESAANK